MKRQNRFIVYDREEGICSLIFIIYHLKITRVGFDFVGTLPRWDFCSVDWAPLLISCTVEYVQARKSSHWI
jgi:hypothetical protein